MSNYSESDQAGDLFSDPADPFKPIPFEVLPKTLADFVESGSRSIGCDPSFIVLPLLPALGSAIGNTRRLVAKTGWAAPPIMWTGSVGDSGTQKSVAQRLVIDPIRQRQKQLFTDQAGELDQHERDLLEYKKAFDKWKKTKSDTEPPEKPLEPMIDRLIVSDTTIEALAPILLNNPEAC